MESWCCSQQGFPPGILLVGKISKIAMGICFIFRMDLA